MKVGSIRGVVAVEVGARKQLARDVEEGHLATKVQILGPVHVVGEVGVVAHEQLHEYI